MRLILHRKATGARGLYRLKSRSFALSLCFHATVVVAMFWGGSIVTPAAKPLLETVIEPNKDKLIWYHFKAELPNIDSPTANKDSTRGVKRSERVVIADTKNGHKSQFVWQPSQLELPKEVEAPNLISLHSASPAPPAPVPPAPVPPEIPKPRKAYVPPTAAPVAKAAPVVAAMAPAPVLDITAAHVTLPAAMPIAQPIQRVTTTPAPLMLPAPAIRMESSQVALPSAPMMAPAQPKPPSDGMAAGNRMPAVPGSQPLGTQNIASINLDSNAKGPLPPGRRAGDFSTAPQTGDTGGAKSNGSNASVPGLTTRGTGQNSGPIAVLKPPVFTPAPSEAAVSYRDVMTHAMGSSLSAPLRVGARTVPASIEARFHDRPIYTMVIPFPKLPEYAADWILWFSERAAPTGEVGAIHAPVPDRKRVADGPPNYTFGPEADVQIAAIIDETGHIQDAVIAKLPAGFPAPFALADLNLWRFKPATRNGVPIAVEAIVDIPFRRILSEQK